MRASSFPGAITRQQVEAARRERDVPEDQAGISDAEVLGVLVADVRDWEGSAILRSCCWALEDAHFHSAEAKLQELFPEAFAE